jgi:Ca2+-transporting ATPase
MALFGFIAFVIIFFVNFLHNGSLSNSLLVSLTLAMSVIPEEIPVAFSSFMALGAYKMSQLGIISRQPQIIENLGAVSVICVDKTGTITENNMQLKSIYDFETDKSYLVDNDVNEEVENVLSYAVLASERDPFDAMEKAIVEAWKWSHKGDIINDMKMVFEYPLEGRPPMMTHVYESAGTRVVAAKGAAERIVEVCNMSDEDQQKIAGYTQKLAAEGYRVIAVATAFAGAGQLPEKQDDFNWQFRGLLALYDPPKKSIRATLQQLQSANIEVKMLTGDYPATALNIAGQAGIKKHLQFITGSQVMRMTDDLLRQTVKNINVFARMFPDAKLKVIEALKANGEIVAMTGDGVNDGPALKSSNIGIAMGKKGTEIARGASDLILTDDKIEKLVTAITEGRKIFGNLKKAVRYIIAIHIPIILVASLPVILGWAYPNIFTPIHIIFLELIMGPTCSIFFEREPSEENLMSKSPRKRNGGLFSLEELSISIVQGLIISGAVLLLYYFFMKNGSSLEETRTIVFTTIILSNVFLTFATRSFTKNILYSSRNKNNLAPVLLVVSALFLVTIHFVPAIRHLFKLSAISNIQFWICFGVAFVSVMWFEVYKTNLPQQ